MTLAEIAYTRLFNQQLAGIGIKSAGQLVNYMGAIQAQDFAMSKWAIGARVPGSTDQDVEAALSKGEIIRTHVLRPTWHLVSANDIYWMLELTAPQVKAAMKFNNKLLEITNDIFTKSNRIIEKILPGKHLVREEIVAELNKHGINTDGQRTSHILLNAELEGLICSGIKNGTDQTYALLEERVPKPKSVSTDEALAKLARLYFTSRAPACLKDFVWWSGLSISRARHALEMVKGEFIAETIGTETYWFKQSTIISGKPKPSVYLLPAFDEYLIAYADRSASIKSHHQPITFTSNGIFKPVIVVNGQVAGVWKRTIKKDTITIDVDFFKPPGKNVQTLFKKAANQFGNFIEKDVITTFSK